ncbi:T9SS type A sorting domain-containing protein [Fulvivirga ulvae]|uniref:T9SS type A sorting domain-containing protein n=1 Tax=Fulvivirga ulvae TaxID=2904245 RepID=UPI001F2D2AEB|nr:T9SS type A sorting domain-containing protein [Fulvivirga ulvae]UII32750.1 T9SS type A sorting domain-containing protein [Fulvivirga ulvae]
MKTMTFTLALTLFCCLQINAQNRGELVSYELIAEKSPDQIDDLLTGATGIPGFFIDFLVPTTFDVRVYKVIYNTVDGRGQSTIGSGALYIPEPYPCDAPLAAYLHGTIIDEASVPSNLSGVEGAIGWAMATDGYVVALPDYIGMGESPGAHPYVHAQSEATASIDMMRAARQLCGLIGVGLNGQVFISGYSQGGHSTLATQREIEQHHAAEFDLEYIVAGAGPYDLSGTQKDFAFDNPFYTNPSFLPYVLQGYQEVYGNIYSSLSDVYVSPYDQQIPVWLDGSLSVEQIDALLPANWKTIFKSDFLNSVENNYFHPANSALRKNNLYAWTPKTETRLYYCTSDEQVDPANSLVAWFNFFLRGAGGRVSAIPLGPFMHRDCAPIALLVGKAKFDQYRQDQICNSQFAKAKRSKIEPQRRDMQHFDDLVNEKNVPDLPTQLREKGLNDLADVIENQGNKTNLKLFPNPANSFTVLDMSQLGESVEAVKIMDTSGKLIRHIDLRQQTDSFELDVRDLDPGMYIIAVEGDDIHYLNLMKQ